MSAAPELAVVTHLGMEHPLMLSLASQLLEHGVFLTDLRGQTFLTDLPDDLTNYKAVALTQGAFETVRRDSAQLERLDEFARHGFVFALDNALDDSGRFTDKGWYDVKTSGFVYDMIAHAGLTRGHPEVRRIQDTRPDEQLLSGFKERLLDYLARVRHWGEFHLHNWKAAMALLNTGEHEDVRDPIIRAIRESCEHMPPAIHHDQVAGLFATAWLLEQTGDRGPLDRARAIVGRVLAERPETEGLVSGTGFVRDPLCLEHQPCPGSGGTQRRKVLWTEMLHMHGATLGVLTRVTGERSYQDEGMRVIRYLREHHQDHDGLLFHCSRDGRPIAGKWSRGQAHAMWGMLYLIEEMDDGDPCRAEVLDFLHRIGQGLKACQDPQTGLWRNVLDCDLSRVESSGTMCFGYTFARCINQGWLRAEDFADMVCKAYRGLKRMYWRGGMAVNCRGTGTGADLAYYIARPQGWAPVPWFTMTLVETTRLMRSGAVADPDPIT